MGGLHLARPQALDRSFPGAFADLRGRRQIREIDGGRVIVIALHIGAFAGQHRRRKTAARHRIGLCEPVGRGHRHTGVAPAGLGAFRIGDAGDRARRIFGFDGDIDQGLGLRFGRVENIERRYVGDDLTRIGDAAIGIFGRRLDHGDGAFDHGVERVNGKIGGTDDGLTFADENPQPQIGAFRPLKLFRGTEPLRHFDGSAFKQARIRRVPASLLHPRQQPIENIERVFIPGHVPPFRNVKYPWRYY